LKNRRALSAPEFDLVHAGRRVARARASDISAMLLANDRSCILHLLSAVEYRQAPAPDSTADIEQQQMYSPSILVLGF
jgi:hypothetical protein